MRCAEFIQATHHDVEYLVEKTTQLHQLETEHSQTPLTESDDFLRQIELWLESELDSESTVIFLISYDEKSVGFAHIKVVASPNKFTKENLYGYIQSLWIEPNYRKQGFARQALSFIEQIFREQGLSHYELSYAATNDKAEKFWSKCGLSKEVVSCRKRL